MLLVLLLLLFLLPTIRVIAEQFLVTFRINETLTDIRNVTVQERRVNPSSEGYKIKDFVTFRRMVSPSLIRVLYWVGTVGIVVGSLAWLILGSEIMENPALRFLGTVAILVVGIPLVRVYSEVLIVAFRINETFTDIRDATRRQIASSAEQRTSY